MISKLFTFSVPELVALPIALSLIWLFYRFVFSRRIRSGRSGAPPFSSVVLSAAYSALAGLAALLFCGARSGQFDGSSAPFPFGAQVSFHVATWSASILATVTVLQLCAVTWQLFARRKGA